ALAIFATDAAVIWFQRDVLLERRYWPKHTVLQLVNYPHAVPHGGEAKIEMRAWKWVVATNTNAEGWRPLEWEDIIPGTDSRHSHDYAAFENAGPTLKAIYWAMLPPGWKSLTLDEVENRLQPQTVAKYRGELGSSVIGFLLRNGTSPQWVETDGT